jgi:hypothetical protein
VSQESQPNGSPERLHRYACFYLMRNDPERVRLVAPGHVSHWQQLGFAHYLGGPFEDRAGGLITFDKFVDCRSGRRAEARKRAGLGSRRG